MTRPRRPSDASRRLGRRLLDARRLTPEQLEACLSEQDRRGGSTRVSLGAILVERGILTPRELAAQVPEQLPRRPSGSGPVPRAPLPAGTPAPMATPLPYLAPGAAPHPPTRAVPPPQPPGSASGSARLAPVRPISDPAAAPAPGAPSRGGERIGRYAVVSELGRGGMGVVYRAWDAELGRDVAVKMILDPDRMGDRGRQRLQREARAAASLRHPGIVSVHEVGEHEGRPYLVMDFVDGRPLDEAREQDGLGPRRVAEIVRELAAALAHAHAAGVVHRDVKPQNILVDRAGRAHLVDFGLAAQTLVGDDRLTRTGQLLGTPGYLAPEQARGDRGAVGPAADVFAVGGVLYWALTGEAPFAGETVLEVLRRVLHEEPVPPRRRDPRVHPDLETIALRCLEKDPARRYESAAVVEAELGRFLAGEAIHARPIGGAERARRWARRHPARLAAISLAALLALGAPAGLIVHSATTAAERARAASAERAAIVQSARTATDEAWGAFADARDAPERVEGDPLDDEARRQRQDALLALALEAFAASHRLVAVAPEDGSADQAMFRAASALGEVALDAEQWSVAASAFERALATEVAPGQSRADLARVETRRTAVALEHRRAVEGVLEQARTGALAKVPGGYEDALFQIVRYPEAQTVRLLGDALDEVSDALGATTRGLLLSAAEPIAGESGSRLTGLDAAIDALVASVDSELDASQLDLLRRAIARLEQREAVRRASAGRPSRAPSLSELLAAAQDREVGAPLLQLARLAAEALGRLGIREGAIAPLVRHVHAEHDQLRAVTAGISLCLLGGEEAERAVLLAGRRFGLNGIFWSQVGPFIGRTAVEEQLPESANAEDQVKRGVVLATSGDYAGAVAAFDAALAIDPAVAGGWMNRASARARAGDPKGALEDFERALELAPDDPMLLVNRAGVRAMLNDFDGALADLDRAVALAPDDAFARSHRGLMLNIHGRNEEAIVDLDRAIELGGGDARVYDVRGTTRLELGDRAGAIADFRAAIAIDPRHALPWRDLAVASLEVDDVDEALVSVARALELAPGDPTALFVRGRARAAKGNLAGAEADFDAVIAFDAEHYEALGQRGLVRARRGDREGARADLRASLDLISSQDDADELRRVLAELDE